MNERASQIKPSVVIIDDDEQLDEELKKILTEEGYPTQVFSSTRFITGFDFSKKSIFLVDLWFNGRKDGVRQVQALQKRIRSNNNKIIMMSSDPDLESATSSLDITGYIKKPLDFEELLRLIKGEF